jgi:hypothetical protein
MGKRNQLLLAVFCVATLLLSGCDPTWYRDKETVWNSTDRTASLEFRYGLFWDYRVFYIEEETEYVLTSILASDCNELIDWKVNASENILFIRTYQSNRFPKDTRLQVFSFSEGQAPKLFFERKDANITEVRFSGDVVQYEIDNAEWLEVSQT